MNQNAYYEKILNIMRDSRDRYQTALGGTFTHTMPTHIIRTQFNRESALELTGPDMFKAMNDLCKQGYVIRHPDSRIGQGYWQLTEKADT